MDTVRDRLTPLEQLPANRQMVEQVFAEGLISPAARDYALDMILPPRQWGLWVSRLLLALGVGLVLSGIVYFFAFNWNAIPPMIKLGSVEFALVGCLIGTHLAGLQRILGQMLLLAAATLAGVFLAVFGQIYQTGADAWTLFAAWAALILPWTVIGEFAPLWGLWMIVANLGIAGWWVQDFLPTHEKQAVILPLLALFNGALLVGREHVALRKSWMDKRWTRTLPGLFVLSCCTVACVLWVISWEKADAGIDFAAVCGAAGLGGFYAVYRYLRPDLRAVSAAVLCACLIAQCLVSRILWESLGRDGEVYASLLQCLITLGMFGGAIAWLRLTKKQMEEHHA